MMITWERSRWKTARSLTKFPFRTTQDFWKQKNKILRTNEKKKQPEKLNKNIFFNYKITKKINLLDESIFLSHDHQDPTYQLQDRRIVARWQ